MALYTELLGEDSRGKNRALDLDYTAKISMQMNVPDRIHPVALNLTTGSVFRQNEFDFYPQQMNVPKNIFLSDESDEQDVPGRYISTNSQPVTPEAILKNHKSTFASNLSEAHTLPSTTPSISDLKSLQNQIDKLSRKVLVLERESRKRTRRDLIFYPIFIGFVVFQIVKVYVNNK